MSALAVALSAALPLPLRASAAAGVDPPGVPVLEQPVAGDGTITVVIDAGSGGPVEEYHLTDSAGHVDSVVQGAPRLEVRITGLTNGQPDQVRAQAINSAGTSAFSPFTAPLTPQPPQGCPCVQGPTIGTLVVIGTGTVPVGVRIDGGAEVRVRPGHLTRARRLLGGPHVAVVRTLSSRGHLTLRSRVRITGGAVTVLKIRAVGPRVTGHGFGLVTRIVTFKAAPGHVALLAVASAITARVQGGQRVSADRGLASIRLADGPAPLVLSARGATRKLRVAAGDMVVAIAAGRTLRADVVTPPG